MKSKSTLPNNSRTRRLSPVRPVKITGWERAAVFFIVARAV